uniref:SAM-dependent MTase RsmB/NOP-type domain-containing protein n=1 Tax=Araucaria cunninghamii TaxID=56994 RepID=A0A0D6R5Z1_ARACU
MAGRGQGHKRGRTQRRHFKQARENVWKKPKQSESQSQSQSQSESQSQWEPFVSSNLAFEEYYKEQGIIPDEEWDKFLSFLQKPLPATFRINSNGQFSNDILSQLENEFLESLNADDVDGNAVEFVRPLPWYPGKLAWRLNFSRMQLRKNHTLERIHEFLKQENEIGNITRQEAVSMVPPLFLDVHSHHYVLDMCAAPGSKTFQLLEMIHGPVKLGLLPDGMVIANDVDVQRCNLLIHQTKRMCSANLMVTNHEAQNFPVCRHNSNGLFSRRVHGGGEGSGRSELNVENKTLRNTGLDFDRILCDVPCSGDGTIRKAPDIWRKWNTGLGNGVHRLQVQIVMRGVALLKVGGKLVYSTCSMNPVEDEAVVGEVLRQFGGSVELLDMTTKYPQLKRRPGLKTWKVRDKGYWLTSYRQVHRYRKTTIVPSMFPSGKSWDEYTCNAIQENCGKEEIKMEAMSENDTYKREGMPLEENSVKDDGSEEEAEVASLPLERCMRILPHDQDTGGFFIAVFQKVSPSAKDMESKQPYKRCNSTSTQDSKHNLFGKIGVDANTKEHVLSELDTTAHALLIENDTFSHHDVEVTQSERFGSTGDIHSDGLNAGESKPSGHGKSDSETETCETVDDSQKKNKADTGDTKSHQQGNEAKRGKIQQQGRWRGVDPVVFFTDEKAIESIFTFYGIDESFQLKGHLVTRNSDTTKVKRIYYVSSSVHNAIEFNHSAGQLLKITSVGLKMFERQTAKDGASPCAYRISSEGLPLLIPYMRRQILYASLVDFRLLLSSRTLPFKAFQDPKFATEVLELEPGCCVIVLRRDGADTNNLCLASNLASSENPPIVVGCWKGRTNLSLMVSKLESQELLGRIFFRYGKEIPEVPHHLISNDNHIEETDETQNVFDNDVDNGADKTEDILGGQLT